MALNYPECSQLGKRCRLAPLYWSLNINSTFHCRMATTRRTLRLFLTQHRLWFWRTADKNTRQKVHYKCEDGENTTVTHRTGHLMQNFRKNVAVTMNEVKLNINMSV